VTGRLLPEEFVDLEPFVERWCLASETERYAQRMATPIDEMSAFYEACFERAEEAIAYCDRFTLDGMPADAVRLLHLIQSLLMVSFPVEVWGQARIPDSGEATLERFIEPLIRIEAATHAIEIQS
jgi:hypothetical protein